MKMTGVRMRNAFTLIELLVVIAIIAILAAILFPVFSTAREKARQSSCSSNLKQLGLAITQYEQDYDESPPDGNTRTYSVCGWAGEIYPYVKSKQVYICPDDTSASPSCSYLYNRNIINAFGGSYTMNQTSAPVYPISKYTSVSSTVLLCEVQGSDGYDVSNLNSNPVYNDNYAPPNSQTGYSPDGFGGVVSSGAYDPYAMDSSGRGLDVGCNNQGAAACGAGVETVKYATGYPSNSAFAPAFLGPTGVHSGGSNYLLADGHVKWYPGSKVTAGTNNGNTGNCGSTTQAANTQCSSQAAVITWSIF